MLLNTLMTFTCNIPQNEFGQVSKTHYVVPTYRTSCPHDRSSK